MNDWPPGTESDATVGYAGLRVGMDIAPLGLAAWLPESPMHYGTDRTLAAPFGQLTLHEPPSNPWRRYGYNDSHPGWHPPRAR